MGIIFGTHKVGVYIPVHKSEETQRSPLSNTRRARNSNTTKLETTGETVFHD